MGTVKVGSCKVVKVDDLNYAVQRYENIVNSKTKESRKDWKDVGYFGHRLDWAVESAIFKSMPLGDVTVDELRSCTAEIIKNMKVKP
jgi:hypothetical protein